MPPKVSRDRLAALNIRNIPRDTFYRLKMAAAAQTQDGQGIADGID